MEGRAGVACSLRLTPGLEACSRGKEGERKKEKGRRKKEEGRRKKEENVSSTQRKMPRIFFPSPENTPSITRRTRCFTVPSWRGHKRPGIVSPSLKYSL